MDPAGKKDISEGKPADGATIAYGKLVEETSPSTVASASRELVLFGPTKAESPSWLLQMVLPFLSWGQRGELQIVSKAFLAALPLDKDSSYWRTLCARLSAEAGLYFPVDGASVAAASGWKGIFTELWRIRHAFGAFDCPEDARSFRLQAMVRFRPASGREAQFGTASMALPLQQR
jgi:hypothetical protein